MVKAVTHMEIDHSRYDEDFTLFIGSNYLELSFIIVYRLPFSHRDTPTLIRCEGGWRWREKGGAW